MTVQLPPGITIRPARPEDASPLAAIAATVWEGTDYLPSVFDEWLTAPDSAFVVIEGPEPVDGSTVVGCVRGVLVAPGEGWVEGLRVHPAVRRRGYGRKLMEYATSWCMSNGARVTRFVTDHRTTAVVRIAADLGYRLAIRYVPSIAPAAADGGATYEIPPLNRVAPEAVRTHWARLSVAGLAGAVDAFLTRGWHMWEINVQLLEQQAREGNLYYLQPTQPEPPAASTDPSGWLQPAWVGAGAPPRAGLGEAGTIGVLRLSERGFVQLGWLAGPASGVRDFGHAARRMASDLGVEAATTLIPEGSFVEGPLTQAGFSPRSEVRALLYEYRIEWC